MTPPSWAVLLFSIRIVLFALFITSAIVADGNGLMNTTCRKFTVTPSLLRDLIASFIGPFVEPQEIIVTSALSGPKSLGCSTSFSSRSNFLKRLSCIIKFDLLEKEGEQPR